MEPYLLTGKRVLEKRKCPLLFDICHDLHVDR